MARKLECCELRTIYVEEYYFKKRKTNARRAKIGTYLNPMIVVQWLSGKSWVPLKMR